MKRSITSYGFNLLLTAGLALMATVIYAADEGDGNGNSRFGDDTVAPQEGQKNTAIGVNAGGCMAEGIKNTTIGFFTCGIALGTTAQQSRDNVLVGAFAGGGSFGNRNTFIGSEAGRSTHSNDNTYVGYLAGGEAQVIDQGESTGTGGRNVFVGSKAGRSNESGLNNVFVGEDTGSSNESGNSNVFVGRATGRGNVSGTDNVFVGSAAGVGNVTGNENVYIGHDAGRENVDGSQNVMVGHLSGRKNISSFNTMVGTAAGELNTEGFANAFFGHHAGKENSIGDFNTIVGSFAGRSNTEGSSNSFFGKDAGEFNTTGNRNTFLGYFAGSKVTTGSSNTFVGTTAGSLATASNKNTLIGGSTRVIDGIENATAIGSNAEVARSNAMVLGSIPFVNGVREYVDVGIGTTTPAAPLHIQRTTEGVQEIFRFTNTGGSFITWEKESTNAKWFFTHEDASGGRLILDHQFNDVANGPEFALSPDGNLEIKGTLTELSDENAKQDITELEGRYVLARLEQVPVSQWAYKASPESRHVGPMAQDFHRAFGLGKDDTRISPRDMAGVNMAAIKALRLEKASEIDGLKKELVEKDAEIASLEERLERLEALIQVKR